MTTRTGRRQIPPGRKLRGTIGAHLVALVVIQVVLVWGLIAFAAVQDFRNARSDAEARATTAAKLAAGFVASELDYNDTALADLPNVLEAVTIPKLCELIESTPEDNDTRWFHATAHLLRPDGSPACPNERQPNLAGESWFKAALKAPGQPVHEGPLIDPITKKGAIMYAISVPGSLVLAYSNELESFGPAMDNQFGTGPAPARFVVTDAGRSAEIASSNGRTGRSTSGTGFTKPVTSGTNTFEDLDGTERIYAEAEVEGRKWHVYAGIAKHDAFADATRALRERIIFAIAILAIVLLAAAVIQRRFVLPIRALSRFAKEFGRGESVSKVEPGGPVELAALGDAMNEMVRLRAGAEKALQKAFEAEQKASAELREIDGMRNAFLMAISHELRTPLTSVVGYAALLDEGLAIMSNEEVATSVRAIANQSKRLERLLLDLLDVERLSRGIIEPNRQDVDVSQIVHGVVERSGAADRITVECTSPVRAEVDPALVERILENLVRNAVKHTPRSTTIWVRVSRRDGELRLIVEDDGPGIPDELKQTIFEPFKQGDVPEHAPGTGVGLTLVSQFTRLHGGRAWVEDRRGGGASFRVTMPASTRPRGTRRKRVRAVKPVAA